MELEQLRIFMAVASHKSFSEAARRLYISHSTTSRAVSALEKELGVKLMLRDNHVAALTPAGQTLLQEGAALLELERAVSDKVKAAALTEKSE